MIFEYFYFLSIIGVVFFVIFGILLGYEKSVGGFGVVVVVIVIVLGGGIFWDILFNKLVFWIV